MGVARTVGRRSIIRLIVRAPLQGDSRRYFMFRAMTLRKRVGCGKSSVPVFAAFAFAAAFVLAAYICARAADSGAVALSLVEPPNVARSQSLTLKTVGPFGTDQAIAVFAEPCSSAQPGATSGCSGTIQKQIVCVKKDAGSCSAIVPLDLPLGTYAVALVPATLTSSADLTLIPSLMVTVASSSDQRPVLLGVMPTVSYPPQGDQIAPIPEGSLGPEPVGRGAHGSAGSNACQDTNPQPATISLLLTGSNFSRAGSDNRILWKGCEMPVCWKCDQSGQCAASMVIGTVDRSGREIQLRNISIASFSGISTIAVSVGSDTSETKTITISRAAKDDPRWGAIVALLVIGVLLFLILANAPKARVGGTLKGLWTRLMIDPETQTYSLSKFQFFLWTAAAVLAYLEFFLARYLVQGRCEFPAIPPNLPSLLAVSAGTTVAASGIGSAIGSKGAGREEAGWSDLLTIGGVVVPERVQFVVWTIVGVVTFLSAALLADPAAVQNLPGVPEEFLLLMGVSSAGYLGGKLVRKPGPIVAEADALWELETPGQASPQKLTVNIIGQNLARTPGIRFDGQDEKKVVYVTKDPRSTDSVLEFVTKDPKSTDDNLASQLRLTIRDQNLIQKIVETQKPPQPAPYAGASAANATREDEANKADLTAKSKISLTNPDGQMAEWSVRIKTKSPGVWWRITIFLEKGRAQPYCNRHRCYPNRMDLLTEVIELNGPVNRTC